MKKGTFISLEGGEGAGKSTQAKLIAETLEKSGVETVVTREPGGTFGAEAIRELVISGAHERWSGMTELLLLYAARLDHVDKLIKPALNRGAWVICDRFADSSMAYQGYARGIGPERVKALHEAVLGDFKPDLTLLFDIDPILALRRVETRGEELNRFDTENLEFHKKLREGFLTIAEQEPERFFILDAASSRAAQHTQIKRILMNSIPGLVLA
jgi:dTMP kinase